MRQKLSTLLVLILSVLLLTLGCQTKPKPSSKDKAHPKRSTKKESAVKTARRNLKVLPPIKAAFHGAYIGSGEAEDKVTSSNITRFEQLAGKQIAIGAFGNFWGENYFPESQLKTVDSHGGIPLVLWYPWGKPYWEEEEYQPKYSLQSIIDGKHDTYIRKWARGARVYGRPMMLAFGLEMNGDWFPWSGVFQGGGKTDSFGDPTKADGPERFRAACQHIVRIFQQEKADNITWVFHANAGSYPKERWNDISDYWPGEAYVDWTGLSVYGAQYKDEDWVTFTEITNPAYHELCRLTKKPLILAEWGVAEWPSKGDKAFFIREGFNKMKTKYPRVKAAVWWQERWENDDGTWSDIRINSSAKSLKAYRTSVADPYWLSRPE